MGGFIINHALLGATSKAGLDILLILIPAYLIVFIKVLFLGLSLSLTSLFFVYALNQYFLLSFLRRYKPPKMLPVDGTPRPFVSVQLPIYNERYVVHRLLEACVKMVDRYGINRGEICILDDSTDDTVQLVDELASSYQAKGYNIRVLRRSNRSGYKAGALQAALENTTAEFISIFDADYTPQSDFLLKTVPYLQQDESLAIVQGRWTHLNRFFNHVTSAAAIGIDVHFLVEQTGRYAAKCFQNFNGSGGVIRRSALLEAGGWQSDTLAEDLDASYRIQLRGYHILYLRDLPCPGEIPPTLPGFKKQQARWANGSLRTARKLIPSIIANRRMKAYQRLEAILHLSGYILHPLMYLSFLVASFGAIFELDTFLQHARMVAPMSGLFTVFSPQTAQQIHDVSWAVVDTMVVLSFAAAWISPIFSLKLQKLSFRKNMLSLLVLFLLGSGISMSNTLEAIKALFTNRQWEFERTPKYANIKDKEGWRRQSYQVSLDSVLGLELASCLLGIVATFMAIVHQQYPVLSILVPYTASYIFVSVLTLRQSRSRPAQKVLASAFNTGEAHKTHQGIKR